MSQEGWSVSDDVACRACRLAEELLTAEELAGKLKVPKSWVYKATRAGLPTVKVGHYSRFLLSEVMAHLRSNQECDAA
jgi:excisionase family DNA binding protein